MCLCNISEPKIATEPITVYKILFQQNLEFSDNNEFVITSPYFSEFVWQKDVEYTSKIKVSGSLKGRTVENAFHSFVKKGDCYKEAAGWHVEFPILVARCEIPAGSTYYEGTVPVCVSPKSEDIQVESIASDKIILKDFIDQINPRF